MGADMYGGGTRSLHFSQGCYEINRWCAPYMPDRSHIPWDEQMGVFDIPPDAVKKADQATPEEWSPEHTKLDQQGWEQVRRFLRETALAGEGVHGGY